MYRRIKKTKLMTYLELTKHVNVSSTHIANKLKSETITKNWEFPDNHTLSIE